MEASATIEMSRQNKALAAVALLKGRCPPRVSPFWGDTILWWETIIRSKTLPICGKDIFYLFWSQSAFWTKNSANLRWRPSLFFSTRIRTEDSANLRSRTFFSVSIRIWTKFLLKSVTAAEASHDNGWHNETPLQVSLRNFILSNASGVLRWIAKDKATLWCILSLSSWCHSL